MYEKMVLEIAAAEAVVDEAVEWLLNSLFKGSGNLVNGIVAAVLID